MNFLADVRYALRGLGRRKGSWVAIASLACGIAASVTVFALLDAMALRPLAVDRAGELVSVEFDPALGQAAVLSFADYRDLAQGAAGLTGLAAYSNRGTVLIEGDRREDLSLTVVSGNFFELLGVRPRLGRLFDPAADARLPEPPEVLSYGLWQRRFGGSSDVIGRVIRLRSTLVTVVGVLDRDFPGLDRGVTREVWAPPETWVAMYGGDRVEFESRRARQFEAIGRLRPGAGVAAVQAQVDAVAASLARQYPETHRQARYRVTPFSAGGDERAGFFAAPILLVLLIACANAATILLAQTEARRREVAVRLGLGASRGRLLGQWLTEGFVLGAIAGAAGLLLAAWLIQLTPALLPPGPAWMRYDVRMDARVVLFSLAAALVTPLLFAVSPAWQAARTDVRAALKGERDRAGFSLRRYFVAGEIALAMTLLAASGLLLRSFLHARNLQAGFDPGRELWIGLVSPGAGPLAAPQVAAQLAALPGVRSVTYARRVPMAGYGGGAVREVRFAGAAEPVPVKYNNIAPNYFEVTGLRLLRGRPFTDADRAGAPRVAIVNPVLAAKFLGGREPIGERLRIRNQDWEIVGVAEDAPVNRLHESPAPFLYVPFAQAPSEDATFVVDPAAPGFAQTARCARSRGWTPAPPSRTRPRSAITWARPCTATGCRPSWRRPWPGSAWSCARSACTE